MKLAVQPATRLLFTIVFSLCSMVTTPAIAGGAVTGDTTLSYVAVNGGIDTSVSGTTCIQAGNVSATCPGSFLAIQNNNHPLLSAALMAKATNATVNIYYELGNTATTFHCPGLVMTPCSVISIWLK